MRSLALVVALAACSGPATPTANQPSLERGLEPPQPTLRLPRNFVPTSYTARLAIDPGRKDFTGAVLIAGTVAERSSVIWLHGKQLRIAKAVAVRGETEIGRASCRERVLCVV